MTTEHHETSDAGSAGSPQNRSTPASPATSKAHPQWIAITSANARRSTFILFVGVVLLAFANWVFGATSSFLFLLLLAWLLSIAMEPVVLWLSRHGVKRGLATGLTMLGLLVLFAGLGELFGSVFLAQLSDLGKQLPQTISTAIDWVNDTFHTKFDLATIQKSIEVTPDKIGELLGRYGGGIVGVFGTVVTFVFDALTILVFAFYLSADSPKLRQAIGSWLPQRYQRVFTTVWEISVEKTGGYVISKLVLATLSAIFHIAFFWFIDVPFWLPLGIFAGIVGQFIPTVGTYIGVVLPALFALIGKPINALWIVLFATVYQQIENYVFTPKVSRKTMDVHPAIALGSVIAGAALFGPIGALIGIPLAAVALAIMNTFSQRHELVPELASLQAKSDEDDRDDEHDDDNRRGRKSRKDKRARTDKAPPSDGSSVQSPDEQPASEATPTST
ncbi:MAG: AI-2E family transporter [Humibacillus sp.]|nr:AI-2E family transporter [Humibacillus sp.]MDN5776509.1 AI-2E family transporter [Humibacillus sp.]